ncbi:hypothetical protein [Ectopseudomonas oleovorans]|uniref:hypothetical protein n=1 Tax=Ectopseudomonas oleovorans TaxID=301 RepID=UPI0019CFF9A5|nr:hypothetical protein [Pseudomonas oleovorans]MBN7118790.1 hypothetical protein [Pseudomonas oleovorans]MBN7132296.1 hypothetical protein [Pseudomonas oleovorans]MBN7140456.1 hypothetical protein [Pseudomonas oleovorans]
MRNVFVLCTGRCGSVTFIEACRHITNYSSAHESLSHAVGAARFAYPAGHIEADNRLSWVLGRLDRVYGDEAFYVHLTRDTMATARSFLKRFDSGIMQAYRGSILMGAAKKSAGVDPLDFCVDYCETVNANIESFLKSKTHTMKFALERASSDFVEFWERVGAQGDINSALAQWQVRHNASA